MRWTWLSYSTHIVCCVQKCILNTGCTRFCPRKRFIDDINEMIHVCRTFERVRDRLTCNFKWDFQKKWPNTRSELELLLAHAK